AGGRGGATGGQTGAAGGLQLAGARLHRRSGDGGHRAVEGEWGAGGCQPGRGTGNAGIASV
ncbi:MAG: hypothetical protein ACK40Q_03875, partial [Pseudothermotoga sp.]